MFEHMSWNWLDLPTTMELERRGLITETEMQWVAQKWAFPPDLVPKVRQLRYTLLDREEIKTLYWRKALSPQEVDERLEQLGYAEHERRLFQVLWSPTDPYTGMVPPFVDIIRMAVRDVFDPEAVQRYGLDWYYPTEVANYADMTGFGDFWARKYWESHWIMPGYATAQRMLFLSPTFTLQDMEKMLRYADYPPALIQSMIDAAYYPLTRVDVRRMHKVGVLSGSEVYDSYKALGYNDLNAQRMTDFTIAYNTEEERATGASYILKMLEEYLISEGDAWIRLADMGYDDDVIEVKVTETLLKRMISEEDDYVAQVERQYVRGEITLTEASAQFAARGYSDERIQILLDKIRYTRDKRKRKPSLADYGKFLAAGIITPDGYLQELQNLGFTLDDATRYLTLIGI